jgi:hypothetical protein
VYVCVCYRGTGEGKKGDWVLVGPNDDVYTCNEEIFSNTYEPGMYMYVYVCVCVRARKARA